MPSSQHDTSAPSARDDAAVPRTFVRAVVALIGATSCLIVLGALVRAHDAGLACPDWPQCFGTWIPEMDFQVAFEWSHRFLAGSVGLIFGALFAVGLRRPTLRSRSGRWLALAAVLLAVQIVLGGLTVILQLAPWTVTAHLLTGNAFNASLLLIALSAGAPAQTPSPGNTTLAPSPWLWAFAVVLALQLALGGAVSSQYAGLACPEWPTCNGGAWFPSVRGSVGWHLAHRMNGYLLFALALGLALHRGAWRVAPRLALPALLVALQIGVGVANVRFGLPVEVTALHSALAAALVLVATWLCYTHNRHATL